MRRFASVAQLVEQGTENPRVAGSIPTGGTIFADLAHLVERHLAKVEVASSSLVIRSKKQGLAKASPCFFIRADANRRCMALRNAISLIPIHESSVISNKKALPCEVLFFIMELEMGFEPTAY